MNILDVVSVLPFYVEKALSGNSHNGEECLDAWGSDVAVAVAGECVSSHPHCHSHSHCHPHPHCHPHSHLIPTPPASTVLRILRLARIFRLFKVSRYSIGIIIFTRALLKSSNALFALVSHRVVLFECCVWFSPHPVPPPPIHPVAYLVMRHLLFSVTTNDKHPAIHSHPGCLFGHGHHHLGFPLVLHCY